MPAPEQKNQSSAPPAQRMSPPPDPWSDPRVRSARRLTWIGAAGSWLVFGAITESFLLSALIALLLLAIGDGMVRSMEPFRRRRMFVRTQRAFWDSLSWKDFESELGNLYRRRGYHVVDTPPTGDRGVDLVVRKGGEKFVVQCKKYSKRLGPAAARELFGTMHAQDADGAVLAATSGFTKSTRAFAKKTGIVLLDLDGIIRLQMEDYSRLGSPR